MSDKRYRCGWCGLPTTKEGGNLTMSQIGLKKDLALWDDATLVPGNCCRNEQEVIGHAAINESMMRDAGLID